MFEMVDLTSFTDFSCFSLLVLSRSFLCLQKKNENNNDIDKHLLNQNSHAGNTIEVIFGQI